MSKRDEFEIAQSRNRDMFSQAVRDNHGSFRPRWQTRQVVLVILVLLALLWLCCR